MTEPADEAQISMLLETFPDLPPETIREILASSGGDVATTVQRCLEIEEGGGNAMVTLEPVSDDKETALQAIKQVLTDPPVSAASRECLRMLHHALANIVQHPGVEKYRVLPFGAASKFRTRLCGDRTNASQVAEAVSKFLISIGFQRFTGGDAGESFLLASVEEADLRAAAEAIETMHLEMDALLKQAVADRDALLYTTLASLKRKHRASEVERTKVVLPPPKLTPAQMAERVRARSRGNGEQPVVAAPTSEVRAGRQTDFAHLARVKAQIEASRREKHDRRLTATAVNRPRFYDLASLEQKQAEEWKVRAQFMGRNARPDGDGADCLSMGKRMLMLTNQFRAQQGLPPLEWNQAMHDIALVHSKRMALKTVPFGHDGASQRFKDYPFPHHGAAENVAMSQGHADVAKCHVDGWIQSVRTPDGQ